MGKSSVKINLIYNILYQILLIITPLITSPYVSRVIGSNGVGIYSYTYSIANTFALIGMLGVTNYGNRTIAAVQNDRRKRSEQFWNIFALQAIMSLIVLIIYCIFIFGYYSGENRSIFVIQTMIVLCSMLDINWYFFGVEKFKLTVTRNIIIKIANVLLIFILVHNTKDIGLYTGIISGSLLLSNLVIWPFLRGEVDFIKPSIKRITSHLGQAIVLFIPVIAITLYKRIDKIMLGSFSTMSQTGIFENAEKIINIPNSLIAALGTVMLPRMTYLYVKGDERIANKYLSISMEFICFASSALMFGVAGIANEFAPWFFGREFIQVGPLLMVMAPTIFFVSWANVIRTQYLIPLHHDRVYVISVWMGAIINLIINALLIPKYGAMGTVIGTVCAEAMVAVYQTNAVKRQLPIFSYIKSGLYYFFAGVAMFFVVRTVGRYGHANFKTLSIEVVLGLVVYVIFCMPYLLTKHKQEIKSIVIYIKEKLVHRK